MNQSSLAKECPLSQVLSLPSLLMYEIFLKKEKKKEQDKPLDPLSLPFCKSIPPKKILNRNDRLPSLFCSSNALSLIERRTIGSHSCFDSMSFFCPPCMQEKNEKAATSLNCEVVFG